MVSRLASNSAGVMRPYYVQRRSRRSKIWMLECLEISNRDGGIDLAAEGVMNLSVELEIDLDDQVATVDPARTGVVAGSGCTG
jgi:hypothetical protein